MLMNGANWMIFSCKTLHPGFHTHHYFLTSHPGLSLLKPGLFSSLLSSSSPITSCQQIQCPFFSLLIARRQHLACWHVLLFWLLRHWTLPTSSDLPMACSDTFPSALPGIPPSISFSPHLPELAHSFPCFQLLPICWYFFNLHLLPTWLLQPQTQIWFF